MKQRLHLLDALRGFTLLNMIAFHGLWNLVYLFGMKADWYVGAPGYLAPSRKGWNCSCGHINDPEALYCQHCGSRMP